MKDLCWDFHGPRAPGTAAHFARHLEERLVREGWSGEVSTTSSGPGHVAVVCRCEPVTAARIEPVLRPQRVVEA